MPFEIDMLNVGNADAIIIHYFDQKQEYVVLVDAGKTEAHGKLIEDHINANTTKKSIDLAINTHPDDDHIGGFYYLLGSDIEISEFWIHDPSGHKIREDRPDRIKTSEIEKAVKNQLLENLNDLEKSLKYVYESLKDSNSILSLIDENRIPRFEPFAGKKYPQIPLEVLGPSAPYYERKLDRYRDIELLYEEQKNLMLEKSLASEPLLAEEIQLTDREFVDLYNDRSNENNSSVILLFTPDHDSYLFTADAGPEALAQISGNPRLENIYFMQIPHHGSRYSITSQLLDYFHPEIAYISCRYDDNYPCQQLVNILKDNDGTVYATGINGNLRHNAGMPKRDNYRNSKGV